MDIVSSTGDLKSFRRTWAEELAETARLAAQQARQNAASSSLSPMASSRTRECQSSSWNPVNPMAPPGSLSHSSFRDHLSPNDRRQESIRPTRILRHDEGSIQQTPRLFDLAIDYGETRTSISYLIHSIEAMEEGTLRSSAWDVLSINGWPDVDHSLNQVPSESWYSSTPLTQRRDEQDNFESVALEQNRYEERNLYNAEDDDDSTIHEGDFGRSQSGKMSNMDFGDYLWGYTVSQEQYGGNATRDSSTLVRYVKSGLLNSAYDQESRAPVRRVVTHLLNSRIIRKFDHPKKNKKQGKSRRNRLSNGTQQDSQPEQLQYSEQDLDPQDSRDILTDFLTHIFQHTYEQLVNCHGFSPLCKLRLVITVPVTESWSPKSSRIIQESVEKALLATKMAGTMNQNLISIFIIHEPEAAANYIMAATNCGLTFGDSIIILDCGGGSSDIATYGLKKQYPLGLEQELVMPAGDNCGAANWNVSFASHIKARLKDEHYLFQNGETCETIVNRLIEPFETKWKRKVDLNREGYRHYIEVPYLRADPNKRFVNNKMEMDLKNDYIPIIGPWIDRCIKLVDGQFARIEAMASPVQVQKLFLVGGAGDSPSLRSSLRKYLNEKSKYLSYEIELVTDEQKNSGVANSHGAVLTLQNMANGPARIALSSFGFLRTEEYTPLGFNPNTKKMEGFAGHSAASPTWDKVDGKRIVRTIDYFLTKGSHTDSKMVFGPFPTYHTIDATWDKLICREEIYVSDTGTESHYTRAHKNNKDAYVAGAIEVNMTFLKEKIKPIWPETGHVGKKHYRIEYELYAFVEGLTLRYEARWPPGKKGKSLKFGQISIAAAFSPGTR